MIVASELCEELESLNSEFFGMVKSQFQYVGPNRRLRTVKRPPHAIERRAAKDGGQVKVLVAMSKKILTVADRLSDLLEYGGIEHIEQYVSELAASKRRCEQAGITLGSMLRTVRNSSAAEG